MSRASSSPAWHSPNRRALRPSACDGLPAVTDGPYLEAKEHLGGFVIECDSPKRAAEIAARFPDARFAAVEVRPIVAG